MAASSQLPQDNGDLQSTAESGVAVETDVDSYVVLIEELETVRLTHDKVLKALKLKLKGMHKAHLKKIGKKRKRQEGAPAKLSGFAKPTKISDEMAKFLGFASGTEVPRTEVTKAISSYVKTNNLKVEGDGRKVNVDAQLAALTKLDEGTQVNVFGMQKYLKHHFLSAPAAVAA